VIAVVLAVPAGLAYRRAARLSWARDVAIPEIVRLADAGDTVSAMALARTVERELPFDQLLDDVWPRISAQISLLTVPDGADVFVQPYRNHSDQWEPLGQTPLTGARLARAAYRIRIEKEGYEPRLLASPNPGSTFGNLEGAAGNGASAISIIELVPQGTVPSETLPVPATALPIALTGFDADRTVAIAPFAIDRVEVTNRLFKGFVDRGGYTNPGLWLGLPFTMDGQVVEWAEAVAGFVDGTGRNAPAGWELGDYRPGQVDLPVTGISWFEAVAFCRSVGKELPTIYHWARAALPGGDVRSSLVPSIVEASNFGRTGAAAVGRFPGLGGYGTYDMAGNVREWVWNQAPGGRRWIAGGAWNDRGDTFTAPTARSPFDRSPTNGFRCAQYGRDTTAVNTLRGRVDIEGGGMSPR
jgi:formylglycine-generating enzyme required for sulfatase activity